MTGFSRNFCMSSTLAVTMTKQASSRTTQFAQYFLSNSRKECCEKFYHWDYYDCSGTIPPVSGDYYPDWSIVSSYTCLNDMKMPNYMIKNQQWYLSKTLKECCEKHFAYDVNTCLGTQNAGSGDFYADFDGGRCVQDCNGASPCGGIADSWDEKFSTKKACCDAKFWYDSKCMTK